MKAFYIAALAASLVSGAAALACSSGTKYCGHTLREGLGWSYADVVSQVRDVPGGTSGVNLDNVLFKCEDHWYWEKADLHWQTACSNGCKNNGSGRDDACN
ncbi:hypothetical protein B0H63DRAFT_505305 [Podospora didyma]|uniref:Uncharacterized protein n=1 Tax=Podospora didyma TaxID=330526 RepID=A0AAE0U7L0_9PEZI|nr:hypothetical protein B0H63DRAFT_505305 [Podospora didyma]